MANIKITVEGPLMDGHKITFKAPCNCDAVEKLDVRYIKDNEQKSKLFTMKDAHGNDLTGLGNLFYKDAYVDVVLDPNSGSAYLQNAGTNGYLEGKTTPVDNLESDRADLPLSARQGKILNESLEWKLAIANTKSEYTVTQEYRELLVYCGMKADAPKQSMTFIKGVNTRCRIGYYYDEKNYGYSDVTKNGDKLTPSFTYVKETVDAYMTVYYR